MTSGETHHSLRWLAYQLATPAEVILEVSANADTRYRPFWKKRNGKERFIDNPTKELSALQRRIRDELLAPIPLSPIVHGCVKGRSQVTNAGVHTRAKRVSSADVKRCYQSITHRQVYAVFVTAVGLGPELARLLTRITTRRGHLPTGAPTSDVLANLVLSPIDRRLEEIASELGLSVTRFLDNIDYSGPRSNEAIRPTVEALQQIGLSVRHKKTFSRGPHSAHIVTGLTVNGAKASQPKVSRDRVRLRVYELIHARNRGEDTHNRGRSVLGHLANLRRTNEGAAARLVRHLSAAGIRLR